MVVGEPSLMGGEFGDEDERLITRLENTQYDPSVSLDDPSGGPGGPPSAPPNQYNSGPPGNRFTALLVFKTQHPRFLAETRE